MDDRIELPHPALALYEQPEIYRRRWFLLGVLCLSLVMVVMGVPSLNVALPRLQESLGASTTGLQWIVDSYALVFAGLLLAAVFPPADRQRAIAIWVGFAGAGGALGPIVAGALLERYWWGSACLVNV